MNATLTTRTIEKNFHDCFSGIESGNSVTACENAMLTYFKTGIRHPWFNAVVRSILETNSRTAISQLLELFRHPPVPASWFVSPSSKPDDINRILLSQGCCLQERLTGMSLDLHAPSSPASEPSQSFTIERVRTVIQFKLFLSIVAKWWNIPSDDFELVCDFYRNEDFGDSSAWTYFLGSSEDRAIGTSALFQSGESAGIYYVGIDPEARQKGAGTAMTLACIRQAESIGYRSIVLQATPMAVSLYRKLGFEEFCYFDRYRI